MLIINQCINKKHENFMTNSHIEYQSEYILVNNNIIRKQVYEVYFIWSHVLLL